MTTSEEPTGEGEKKNSQVIEESSSAQNYPRVDPPYIIISIGLIALSNGIILSQASIWTKAIALGLFLMATHATGLLYWILLTEKAPLFVREFKKKGYWSSLTGTLWIFRYWTSQAFRLFLSREGLSEKEVAEHGFLTLLGAFFLLWLISSSIVVFNFILPSLVEMNILRGNTLSAYRLLRMIN